MKTFIIKILTKIGLKYVAQWFPHLQILNLLAFIFEGINQSQNIFPGLELPKWIVILQGILATVLPGAMGISHKLMTGEAQLPADRTAAEVHASAVETKDALIAKAPEGTPVAVPVIGTTTATGEMGNTP